MTKELIAEGAAGIDLLAEFLAGLEVWHELTLQRDRIAGLGVAAYPRFPVMEGKAAESSNLDPPPFGQGVGEVIEDQANIRLP